MTTTARPDQQVNDDSNGGRRVQVPQFLQPQVRPEDPADPELVTLHGTTTEPTPTHQRAVEDDGSDAGAATAETGEVGSSPASTGDKPLRALATASQVATAQTMVEAALMGGTALVNARTKTSATDDRWLMNADERASTARPFARILARHSPMPNGGEDASDLADLIEGVVKILAFAIKQVTSRPALSAALPAAPAPQETAPTPAGPGASPSPFDPMNRAG